MVLLQYIDYLNEVFDSYNFNRRSFNKWMMWTWWYRNTWRKATEIGPFTPANNEYKENEYS
jgi:hypothetical protein